MAKVYDPSTGQMVDKYGPEIYQQRVASREALDNSVTSGAVQDKSGPVAEGVGAEALESGGATSGGAGQAIGGQAVAQGAQSGSGLQMLGGAAMMSGNPYLMGAGLGLQVLAGAEQNKRAQQEKQRQEYNERITRRQQLMQQIASQNRL